MTQSQKNQETKLSLEGSNQTKTNIKMTDFEALELDKTGNGYGIIRFYPLMAKKCGKKYGHMCFQDKGGWYIENSLTTLNHKGGE